VFLRNLKERWAFCLAVMLGSVPALVLTTAGVSHDNGKGFHPLMGASDETLLIVIVGGIIAAPMVAWFSFSEDETAISGSGFGTGLILGFIGGFAWPFLMPLGLFLVAMLAMITVEHPIGMAITAVLIYGAGILNAKYPDTSDSKQKKDAAHT
jgi:hypothetical protein